MVGRERILSFCLFFLVAFLLGSVSPGIAEEGSSIVVELNSDIQLPAPADMEGWFKKDGQSLRVLQVADGPGEVVFVLDPSLQPLVRIFAEYFELKIFPTKQLGTELQTAGRKQRLVKSLSFDFDVQAQFLTPLAPKSDTRLESGQVFPYSPTYSMMDYSLLQVLSEVRPTAFPLRYADAAVEAGRWVMSTDRRRAVVMLLGDRAVDRSTVSIEAARSTLERWQVPLLVWTSSAKTDELILTWGSAERLIDPFRPERIFDLLEARHGELETILERQRVLWLDTDDASGVEWTDAARNIFRQVRR